MRAVALPTRVSVVVPTKDRSALLRQALASVRALEGPDLDIELIVADNDSSDDTKAVAAEFGARLVDAPTPGAAAARNVGMRAATGEFIAFLDDDDVWTADHLRPHIALLRQRPDLAAVVGQTVMADPSLTAFAEPWPANLPDDGDLFRAFLAEYPQIGATVARVSVRDSVGYLDEALYGDEDWDWHLRLALAHRVGFVAVPGVLFRQRPGGRDDEDEVQWGRLKCFRRAFFRNVRRAGKRRPSLPGLARIYLRLSGNYAWYFAESARAHAQAQERAAARRCVRRAIMASPLHGVSSLRHGWFRATLWQALPRPLAG